VDTLCATTTTTPPAGGSTTTTTLATTVTTLPLETCATARECLARIQVDALCSDGLSTKLRKMITSKLAGAVGLLDRAASTTKGAKIAKLAGKARKKLQSIDAKAAKSAAVGTKPISAACRDSIVQAVALGLARLDESRF
jgi:hypothetical protein